MSAAQPELDFDAVSEPIAGDTKATVELVGDDWLADADWAKFQRTCRAIAEYFGDGVYVDPNRVWKGLTDIFGTLTIEPRRYSAFWHRAAGKNGFLDADGWVVNTDAHGRNQGKPLRRYRLRDGA